MKVFVTKFLSAAGTLEPSHLEKRAGDLADTIRAVQAREPHRLHGERASNLFAHIVSSLGDAVLVKEEDAGDIYQRHTMQPPDWRIVLRDRRQVLVEVKNVRVDEPGGRLSVRTSDLENMLAYAAVLQVPLRVAAYWSRQRLWTLLDPTHLVRNGARSSVDIATALKHNEMSLVGDLWLACAGPLAFFIEVDQLSAATTPDGESFQLKVRRVGVRCGQVALTTEDSLSLAMYLIRYGEWSESPNMVRTTDGSLTTVEYVFRPDSPDGAEFPEYADTRPASCAPIGILSRMMSAEFNELTSRDADLLALRLTDPSKRLGPGISKSVLSDLELPLAVITALGADQAADPVG